MGCGGLRFNRSSGLKKFFNQGDKAGDALEDFFGHGLAVEVGGEVAVIEVLKPEFWFCGEV